VRWNKFWWIGCAFAVAACAGAEPSEEHVGEASQALTALQARVLGFEAPATDWTAAGRTIGQSTTRTEGALALSVVPNNWTEVVSRPLESLGAVKSTLSYAIRLPATVPWGDTRAVIRIPSQGLTWQELGIYTLSGRAANTFHTVSFSIPASLEAALEGSYTDLEFRIIINVPQTNAAYLIDNIDIASSSQGVGGAGGSGGGGSGGAGAAGVGGTAAGSGGGGVITTDTLSIVLPTGIQPHQAFMSSSDRLQVDARVTLGTPNALEHVSNLGANGLELGSMGFAHANVYNAAGPTNLRSQATVRGFVRAHGIIDAQEPVFVTGGRFPSTPVPATTFSWGITWPPSSLGDVILHQPPSDRTLDPGRYGTLDIHNGSRVFLRSGTYYFQSFNSEPGSQVVVDKSQGPVVIYAREKFRFHGPFVDNGGPDGQVFVGYLGTQNADLQVGFVGTIVAPSATVDLRFPTTGQHRGSFFGRGVHVFSDTPVLRLPFNFPTYCPLPPHVIDDGNPCTVDSCNIVGGVSHVQLPAGAVCTDGNDCNGTEVCTAAGACVNNSPPPPAGSSCNSDEACPTFAQQKCDSTQVCRCSGPNNDDNSCTTTVTNPDGSITHVPDPGRTCFIESESCGPSECNADGSCVCKNDTPDDDNPCTLDEFGATINEFTHTPLPDGTPCVPEFACSGQGICRANAACECLTPTEVDDNPCSEASCSTSSGRCFQRPRETNALCSGTNFCNGSCTEDASCACNTPVAPPGAPMRAGTLNTQFLPNTPFDLANLGHGFAGCEPGFFGGTDHECLAEQLAPKISASDYDFIALNEVFADPGRDRLADELLGEYPNMVTELDSDRFFEFEQDAGLMLLSKWPFDAANDDDIDCFEGKERINGHNKKDKALGFLVYDEGSGWDGKSQKGLGWARLISPTGGRVNVFFTHMQASYGGEGYDTWRNDGLGVREAQFTEVAEVVSCLRNLGHGQADPALIPRADLFMGDLNVTGDLSDLFFDRDDTAQLASSCQILDGTCPALLVAGVYDEADSCGPWPEAGKSLVCFNAVLGSEKRGQNREEWDFYFNTKGTPVSSHPFRGLGLQDTWAFAMTPDECVPTSGAAAPSCPVTKPTDPFLLGLNGPADFDRAFTTFNQSSEQRLDYIAMNSQPPGSTQHDFCAQHVTLAWNLFADGDSAVSYEGGITPTTPGLLLGGQQSISDHIGVNAEINLAAQFCNPTNALAAPPIVNTVRRPTGDIPLRLPYRGAVHWIRVDQPGTYSFNVNPELQILPTVPFRGVTFDNGLAYRVYEKTDLSRPMVPLKGEVREVPPEEFCVTDNSEHTVCHEVPGFKDARFHSPVAPFYVKVFHPSGTFPADWHGDYRFLYRRSQCNSEAEACALAPFEGMAPDPANSGPPNPPRAFALGDAGPHWYFMHVDAPDGAQGQQATIQVTELATTPEPSFGRVEIVRAEDPAGPAVLELTAATTDAAGRWLWQIIDTGDLLDLAGNSDGKSQKYFIRIHRRPGSTNARVEYWVSWQTPLTWLFGPNLGGEANQVRCKDTTDAFTDDEVYMQVVVDDTRYPLGARSGAAPEGAKLDTSMAEHDEVEWTDRVLPRLGNNVHGQPFGQQMAIKFVQRTTLELLEDDDGATLGDDSSTNTVDPLGAVTGVHRVPGANWFGKDYERRGGSLSHERPGKPCQTNADCQDPLICNGFCRLSK
jgi:hypothetical protein